MCGRQRNKIRELAVFNDGNSLAFNHRSGVSKKAGTRMKIKSEVTEGQRGKSWALWCWQGAVTLYINTINDNTTASMSSKVYRHVYVDIDVAFF